MASLTDRFLATFTSNSRLAKWAKDNYAIHSKSQVLGEGTFGVVLAGNRATDSMAVAVKIEEVDEDSQKHQLSCSQLLQTKPHPNILELLETFVDLRQQMFASVFPQALFDLRMMMRSRNGNKLVLGAVLVPALAADLSHALAHLQELRIIHRDVKPANCVVFVGPDSTSLKLGDFGCARVAQALMTPGMCTAWYRAPELFRRAGGKGPARSTYTEAVDVWSLGCVVGEMLTCEELFKAADEQDVVRVIRYRLGLEEESLGILAANASKPERGRLFDMKFPRSHAALQQAGSDFLRKCLTFDASRRPYAATLLTHEMIREHGIVYRKSTAAVAQSVPPPLVASAVALPMSAARATPVPTAAPAEETQTPRQEPEEKANKDASKASNAWHPVACACAGFCRHGKKCHGDIGCKNLSTEGSRCCEDCRCKAVKRGANVPPNEHEYSSGGEEEEHVPGKRCEEPRIRGDTCGRHRHAKFSLVLKACRRLGRHGLLDMLVPCDVEAFLQAPIHDDLVLQLIGAWVKHPVAVEALGRCRPKGRNYTAAARLRCLHSVPSPRFCFNYLLKGCLKFKAFGADCCKDRDLFAK